MWISRQINEVNRTYKEAAFANVTGISDNNITVNSQQEYRQIPMISPFGISSIPSIGSKAVIVPVDGSFAYIGSLSSSTTLNPGELMLYSSGGASIVLKNNGQVLINGNSIS